MVERSAQFEATQRQVTEPLSRALMLELMEQLNTRIDGGHGRVRQSLNELTVEVRTGFDRTSDRLKDHSDRIIVIETERKKEAHLETIRRQDARERTVLIAMVSSIVVTVSLFVIKAWLHL